MSTNKGIKDDTKYKVNLGNSFTKNTQGSYHVFQYNFKPSKIDRTKEGLLKKSGSKLEVHFPTNQGKSLFVGEYTPVKDVECILIFNGSEFTLEKISGSTKTIRELQSQSYEDLNSPTANSSTSTTTPTPATYSSNSNVTPKENGNVNVNLKKRSPTSPPIGSPPLKKVSPEGKKTTSDKYSRNKKEEREKEKREKEKREKEERDRLERERVREREEREKREMEQAITKEDWDNKAINNTKNDDDHDDFNFSESDADSYSENEHDDNELTLVRAIDQNTISTPVTIPQTLSQPLPQLSSLPNPAIPTQSDQPNKDDMESGSSGSEVSGSESDSSGSGSGSESDSGSESESESGSESESQSESESDNDPK